MPCPCLPRLFLWLCCLSPSSFRLVWLIIPTKNTTTLLSQMGSHVEPQWCCCCFIQVLHQQHKEELARVKSEAAKKVDKLQEELQKVTDEREELARKVRREGGVYLLESFLRGLGCCLWSEVKSLHVM